MRKLNFVKYSHFQKNIIIKEPSAAVDAPTSVLNPNPALVYM